METMHIDATARTPEVNFVFADNRFLIRGESYPEDISAFYGPVISKLRDHLSTVSGDSIEFTFELIYFNSSSAKVLMELFESLEEVATNGNAVRITWVCDEEDDNMQEMGEEFAEDLEQAEFRLEKLKTE